MPMTTDYKDRTTAKLYLLEDLPTQYISYKEELSLNLNKSLEHTLELQEEISSGEIKEEKLIFKYGTQIVYGDIELSKLDLELFKLDDDKDYCLIDDDIWYIDYDNKRIMRCRDKIVVIKEEREVIKTMESTTKVRTINSLMRDIKRNKINFNHLVQRQSNQWNKKQKELLIDSLLKGVVLPQLIFAVQEKEMMPVMDIDDTPGTTYENKIEKITYCIDGKQRLTTIYEFINSKSFKDLSEEEQKTIEDSEVSTITYHNISDDEIFTLFQRYNNGVSLAGGQKTRSFCDKDLLSSIRNELSIMPFCENWNITKGQINKNEDEMVIFQSMMIVSGFEYKNFSNKEVERYLSETPLEDLKKAFGEVSDKIGIVHSIVNESLGEGKQKNLKKIHLPMIISCATEEENYKNKLVDFLTNYSSENSAFDTYRSHCTTGTSQKEHVVGRLEFWKN